MCANAPTRPDIPRIHFSSWFTGWEKRGGGQLMINFRLSLLTMAVGSACLLWGCQSAPKSESSTGAQAPAATVAPAAKSEAEGEVVGTPAMESKFLKVKIGMGAREVHDLIGAPTDRGIYRTGKGFIPFYRGSDRYRHEMLYKGQGRLVFSGGAVGDLSGGRLIQIIHNANETGYR
jgi:hypothetical protein